MSFSTGQEDMSFTYSDGGSVTNLVSHLTHVEDSVVCRIPSFTVNKQLATTSISLASTSGSFPANIDPATTYTFIVPIGAGGLGYCVLRVLRDTSEISLDFTGGEGFTTAEVPQLYLPWFSFVNQG